VFNSFSTVFVGFEVAHEVSDSMNEYCRQGTISWAHAIRFLR
ncbi:unnamed protein product, partial [Choristocarpus tenellus]